MKNSIPLLTIVALLAISLPITTNAATQVYDLNADWSGTANPNVAWSYRQGDSLLISDPFPWVGSGYDGSFPRRVPTIEKILGAVHAYLLSLRPGRIEDGDIIIVPVPGTGANILWTAPANGTIDISGAAWDAETLETACAEVPVPGAPYHASWMLTHNGSSLSAGGVEVPLEFECDNPKSFPDDLSLGSGGAAALQNIPVQAGDQVVLAFSGSAVGLNFTITFTSESGDPVSAIEDLAISVVQMNLQNGIENSLDSKLDTALNALGDANLNNDAAACSSLDAFINAVEAQRGNKITNSQANQLVAAAQEIKTLLNCGN